MLLPADLCLLLQPWRSYSRALFPDFRQAYNPLLDAILLFFPWRLFAARSIRAGEIPLWNPDSFCGQPFLANNSSAVLYPLNALHYLVDPAKAYGYVAALHVFLAGAFTYLLLRLLGPRPAAALLGGITFMFCGFLTVWAEYQTPVAATIWLPLALYFWERHARGHGVRFALYAAAPLGLSLLGGHVQYSIYVLMAFAAYAAWRSGLRPTRWAVAAAVVAFGIALAAHQLLPTLELGRYNQRAGGNPLAGVLASALPLRHLVSFLVPGFFGHPVDYNYWGNIPKGLEYVEYCGYLGILPLLLVAPALWLRRDGHTRFFFALAVVALLMALGTPLYALFYYGVPGFTQLANPARILGVFSLAVACLGALGAEAVADLPRERRRTLALALAGLLIAASAAVSLTYTRQMETILGLRLGSYVAGAVGLFLVTALVAAGAIVGGAARPRALWALPAIAAVDLFLFGMRFNPAQDPGMLYFETESLRLLRAQAGQERVLALRAEGSNFLNAMIPNCNLPVGLAEVQGGDAMYPRRYRQFAEFVESRQQGKPVKLGNALVFSSVDTPGVDFLNAAYVLSATPLTSPKLELVASPDLHVYRNRAARPRAFLVHRARVEPTARVLETLAAERFAMDQVAVLEAPPALPLAPAAGPESVRITEARNGRVRVAVEASANALLILADQYFPGWRATVDGREVPVQAANYILRAVAVPAGRHVVEFTYRPASFRLGLYLTLATLSLLTAAATTAAVRRR